VKSYMKISDHRLEISHTFNAPRPAVFGWWSQPEKLQQWSGCEAATDCEVTMDFRVGGSFRQKMQIAGKGEFAFEGRYDEIVEPQRISYHADLGAITVQVVVEFFDQDGRTRVVMTQEGFPDERSCKTVSQGTLESLDLLDAILSAEASPMICGDEKGIR
jgi:uncharacterized protein YndB with AHSA1/START domain